MTHTEPLAIVTAVAEKGVIGKDGRLPWHLPEELQHFRRVTIEHAVIMGRATYQSIGKPLAKRHNIVLTRDATFHAPGCDVAHDLESAISLARRAGDSEPRIIGGARVYAEALPLATRLFITDVHRSVDGDAFFPALDPTQWREVSRREADGLTYRELERACPIGRG